METDFSELPWWLKIIRRTDTTQIIYWGTFLFVSLSAAFVILRTISAFDQSREEHTIVFSSIRDAETISEKEEEIKNPTNTQKRTIRVN